MQKMRNIGILAHVDAGKTTITEQILFLAGELHRLGNVDAGSSVSDSMKVEQERGISVRSAALRFEYQNVIFNLIDTPGHSDFSGEVERALSVLDGAILVISAAEGIQAQTTVLWQYLRTLAIPTIIFINKIDRITADVEGVLDGIEASLSPHFVLLQRPVAQASMDANIVPWDADIAADEWFSGNVDKIVEQDDTLLMRYLEGEALSTQELAISLGVSCRAAKLHPVLLGVAKRGVGISELLQGIIDFLPQPAMAAAPEPLAARVFKIIHDPGLGKITFLRVFGGKFQPRDLLHNATRGIDEKVNMIKVHRASGWQDTPYAAAGDVVAVAGLKSAAVGDVLGTDLLPEKPLLSVAPFSVQVVAEDPTDYTALAQALGILNAEEPNLNFVWDRDERTFTVEVMGYIHIQILQQIIHDRFAIAARLTEPIIIYRETPLQTATGSEAYTMPKPCWAVVSYRIAPGKPGSGLVYHSEVSVDKIASKYQKEIQRMLPGALKQGPLGWQVTDIDITLIDGEDHEVHSRPGDFTIATMMAVMKGLTQRGTTLLEPVFAYSITIEEDKCGRVMTDIIKMRGSYEPPVIQRGFATISGVVPAATSLDYQITLSSISSGKAVFYTHFSGYRPCAVAEGSIRPYNGVHPLDRSKFILKMRGAIIQGTL